MTCESETIRVQLAAGGDLDAFGELCGRYYAPMLAVAYAVLGDEHLARDAAQETFAKALVQLPRLRHAERFGPWLTQICRNVARDMLRSRTRYATGDSLWEVADHRGERETDRAVRRALGRLPAAVRELIVLRYYDNLPHEEIARLLETTRGAINGRLLRARRMLAKALIREGILENCHAAL